MDVKTILHENKLFLKKKLGQNYIVDESLVESLVSQIKLDQDTPVLEIGTGLGILTTALLNAGYIVHSYEIDKGVFGVVKNRLKDESKLVLSHQDFLQVDLASVFNGPFQVVANIPYHVTSSILIRLWENFSECRYIYLLVQKEVGERLLSNVGSRECGFLTVLLQTFYEVKIIKKVGKQVFFPVPEVESYYISLIPKANDWVALKRKYYFDLLKYSFNQRRKKLLPRLKKKNLSIESLFIEKQIDKNSRPEELSLSQWIFVLEFLYKDRNNTN